MLAKSPVAKDYTVPAADCYSSEISWNAFQSAACSPGRAQADVRCSPTSVLVSSPPGFPCTASWAGKLSPGTHRMLTPGKGSSWGGAAMASCHGVFVPGSGGTKCVGCGKQTERVHALVYAGTTCPFPSRSTRHTCPLSRQKTHELRSMTHPPAQENFPGWS